MQARLRRAVRALRRWPGLVGAPAPVQLAALVLMAKTPAKTGVVEIRGRELGRWIGLSQSRVASFVVPALRRCGVARIDTTVGEFNQHTGLRCELVPLWEAHGVVGHPLALAKDDLATMLRFFEALFAPGWGGATDPGPLASRTGRGAATERLALLLMALDTTEEGLVRLCGGIADGHRGRPAETLARMLGCEPSGAEGVLGRLSDAGVALCVRKRTGSDLRQKSRLVIPAVASAHRPGSAVAGVVEAPPTRLRPVVSDPGDTAMPGEDTAVHDGLQVSGVQAAREPVASDPGDTAALHADHSSVATAVDQSAGSGGFSGYSRMGCCGLPECACAREEQAADTDAAPTPVPVAGGADVPLREEKPKSSAIPMQPEGQEQVVGRDEAGSGLDPAAVALAAVAARCGGLRRVRVPQPADDLIAVLAPVQMLWEQLERGSTRRLVEQATRRELRRVAAWVGNDCAAGYLSRRLTRRLTAQPGRASGVHDPVGWLLGRGLPRLSPCSDMRCDEGVLMHSGSVCELCEDLVIDRRGRRRRVSAEVLAELPDVTLDQRREAFENRLREVVAEDVARAEERRHQVALQEVADRAAADRARAAAEASEQARRARPCKQCGEPESGGLCAVCWELGETERLIGQAVAAAAVGLGDPHDPATTGALAANAEASIRTRLQDARGRVAADGATDITIAVAGRLAAESILEDHRATALYALGLTQQAQGEAARARQAQLRRPHASAEIAQQAEAGEQARSRTAEHLFITRSQAWNTAQRTDPAEMPRLQGRAAVYEDGAAKVRAATAAAVRPKDVSTPGTRNSPRIERLHRVEQDDQQVAEEETARLRAQIAAELPGLAAITAAYHGATYNMPLPRMPRQA
ncbi:hypothetical protein [Streptomyces chattanoogensis]|uniref:hypothetical protein n=1 Tax=Streptomyces chattanoogensis TaxID=66876 RepID=UPI00367FA29C